MSDQFDSDGIPRWAHDQFGGGMDEPRLDDLKLVSPRLDSSNWQIRIEALRAAVMAVDRLHADFAEGTLEVAKRFERYLESGE